MQSLRTRKPTQRQQTKLAKPANRDARKSRVDDKIKKRMSTRYADISAPTDLAGAIPPVPTIPIASEQFLQQQQPRIAQHLVSEPEEIKADSHVSDRKILEDEHFDPDACMAPSLSTISLLYLMFYI
jgi:exocyst complex component 8